MIVKAGDRNLRQRFKVKPPTVDDGVSDRRARL
jgi:hypothetical protein